MRLAAVIALAVLVLLRAAKAEDAKQEPATSDRARVAPGPSERNEPAAAEVRQTPAGGQTGSGPGGKPGAGEKSKGNG